jgi:chaperone protein EcpD
VDVDVDVDMDMIAPGAQVRYAMPEGVAMPTTVALKWLDDYGTPREAEAQVGR